MADRISLHNLVGVERFTVTAEHVALLRHAIVSWDDCEFGAPAIDCKRPYGNSGVLADMAVILGFRPAETRYSEHGWKPLTEEEKNALGALHKQTQAALQIFLATGEMRPGKYEAPRYTRQWRYVGAD